MPAEPQQGSKTRPLVWLDHFHQQSHHGAGSVELAALPAFGDGELFQEILVDLPQHVGGLGLGAADFDVADQVHDLSQHLLVQVVTAEVFWQDSLQGVVVPLDDVHGPVDGCPDVLLSGPGLDDGPAGILGDPEHVPFFVLVGLFGVAPLVDLRLELFMEFLEGVRDVFQEHQWEYDVLVFGCVDVASECVRCCPELWP